MKFIYLTIALAMITACGNSGQTSKTAEQASAEEAKAETAEEQVSNAKIQDGMIVGEFQKIDLQAEPFSSWFDSNYESYNPSDEDIATIKKHINDYEIIAFMGTWCGDSKRETPKLYKVLDKTGYNLSNLKIAGVDRNKTTPDNLEENWDINRVPTIIFLKDGNEVNRFVEYPVETFEKDIAKIVSGAEYKNSYAE
jgi:thiol-disulfide isomerase/thioredoxin